MAIKRIAVYLSEDLQQRLDDLCEATGASTTEIFRRALREYVPKLGYHSAASPAPAIERRQQPILLPLRKAED